MKPQRWIPFVLVVTALAAAASGCSRSAQSYLERGNAQLEQGNVDAAVLEYRNAIEKDATFAPARVKLAEVYLRKRNFAGALGEAVRAADLLPNDVDAQLRAGSLLFAAGRGEDAKARAEKALAVNPKSADAMTLRASATARLGDLDGAIEQMRQAIAVDASAGRQAGLGRLLNAKGLTEEAEASFRQAMATDPKSIDVQLATARFLMEQKRTTEAESGFKAALALDPANLPANAALADFYIAAGRPADAEPYIKKLAEAGDNPVPSLALADYYVSMKRDADAFAVLEKLSSSPRAWAVARSRTAALLYAEGKTAEAHRAIDEVIAKYPAYSEARVMRGRFLMAEGKTDQALVEAQEAVKADPRSGEGHFLAGIIHESKRDLAAAAASFNEVLRLNPRSLPAQTRLASLDLRLGNLATATQHAEQVLQREPGALEAQLILTRSLLARGDVTRAAASAKTLVDRFPQSGMAQNEAALVALARDDRAGARGLREGDRARCHAGRAARVARASRPGRQAGGAGARARRGPAEGRTEQQRRAGPCRRYLGLVAGPRESRGVLPPGHPGRRRQSRCLPAAGVPLHVAEAAGRGAGGIREARRSAAEGDRPPDHGGADSGGAGQAGGGGAAVRTDCPG
jgi:tetratricopeptide (TPR) repeat protein